MKIGLAYDMRVPDFGAPAGELYGAALDQCACADALGFDAVHVGEHHGSEDGYVPSSLVSCAAVAARTRGIPAAFCASGDAAPSAPPRRVAGMGYVEGEFDMFGVE